MKKTSNAIIHPAWLRVNHWLNAMAVVILVLSGWRIYDASPLFGFHFPRGLELGGWLGGALLWHFAAMWILLINGIIYLALNFASGRLGKRFFPLHPHDFWRDLSAALQGRLAHDMRGNYNAVQKFAYLFVIVDSLVLVLSGLVIWKSVQFPLLRDVLGGYDNARIVHFAAMVVLAGFVAVHIAMVALVPRTLVAMLRGR